MAYLALRSLCFCCQALDGFLFVVNRQGKVEFASDNITQYLKYTPVGTAQIHTNISIPILIPMMMMTMYVYKFSSLNVRAGKGCTHYSVMEHWCISIVVVREKNGSTVVRMCTRVTSWCLQDELVLKSIYNIIHVGDHAQFASSLVPMIDGECTHPLTPHPHPSPPPLTSHPWLHRVYRWIAVFFCKIQVQIAA